MELDLNRYHSNAAAASFKEPKMVRLHEAQQKRLHKMNAGYAKEAYAREKRSYKQKIKRTYHTGEYNRKGRSKFTKASGRARKIIRPYYMGNGKYNGVYLKPQKLTREDKQKGIIRKETVKFSHRLQIVDMAINRTTNFPKKLAKRVSFLSAWKYIRYVRSNDVTADTIGYVTTGSFIAGKTGKKVVTAAGKQVKEAVRRGRANKFIRTEYNKMYGNKMSRNHLLQKHRITKNYARLYRAGKRPEEALITAFERKDASLIKAAVRRILEKAVRTIRSIVLIGGAGALVFLLFILILFFMVFNGGTESIVQLTSYPSEPEDIAEIEMQFTLMEVGLQGEIDHVEENHPGYDEYNYSIAPIEHYPHTLLAFLSASHDGPVTYENSEEKLRELFHQMYHLTYSATTETRTRTGTRTNPDTGEQEEYEEEYEVSILNTTLTRTSLESIAVSSLSGDEAELYECYAQTLGGLQHYYPPVDFYWLNYVSSFYGFHKRAVDDYPLHRGVDISVPAGTEIYAACEGIVSSTLYDEEWGNVIRIVDDDYGYTICYAHLQDIYVTAGQRVTVGLPVGTIGDSGNTPNGAMLHLEVQDQTGFYMNPIVYFACEGDTLYGEEKRSIFSDYNVAAWNDVDIPEVENELLQALLREAYSHLGTPYTFGGTPPDTYDCSSFVWWCFYHTDILDWGRDTAQGIYNQSQTISASEAKAGDLIFFTGTYDAGRPVTHVGIYLGNGQMIHCGDPINVTSVSTAYWTSHFYAYGRLVDFN